MQMGRWFGFRRGYRDLVRLFIGRSEPIGRSGTMDLYEAFEGVCRDEMEFREQLALYELPSDGSPPMTPMQVPPLVPQHLLPPTGPGKIYNAEVKSMNFRCAWVERTLVPGDELAMNRNQDAMRNLLGASGVIERVTTGFVVDGKEQVFDAFCASLNRADVLTFLHDYRWSKPGVLTRVIEFAERPPAENHVDAFVLLAPQMAKVDTFWSAQGLRFSVFERSRVDDLGGRYKVYSEERHRFAARAICDLATAKNGLAVAVSGVESYQNSRAAALIFYPVQSKFEATNPDFVSMGFALQFPDNALPVRPVWGVKVPERPDDAVVDNPQDS